MADSEREVLAERLGRYPVQRYPVQHATTQFHLGTLLLHAGETAGALRSLIAAADVFERVGMRPEQAKATLMVGVALRTVGRLDDAAAALASAGAVLDTLDLPAEQAAAAYDLGLVRQDIGDLEGARAAWSRARQLFLAAGYPAQAAAAARDHGASLLAAGRSSDAAALLEQAVALAERAGDRPGEGMAANALGLARLAEGQPDAAVEVLGRALAAFPRSVRPAEHAMAKANLALAHEDAGRVAHARLAARQALAVSSAALTVRSQARALLDRQPGEATEDLLTVLDTEDRGQWVPLLREEMLRTTELPRAERCAVVGGFLAGALSRPGSAYELVESLLHVVIELPPSTYQLLVTAIADAEGMTGNPERLRTVVGSAMARFALPQWQRLATGLNVAAEAAGQSATWR